MKNNLASLIKVKTIVTLIVTFAFTVLSLTHYINASDFLTVFLMIISFYFGTQSEKNTKGGNTDNGN